MPRKKIVAPETVPAQRKRLIRELLRLNVPDLEIVLETVGTVNDLRQETIAEVGQPTRVPYVGEVEDAPELARPARAPKPVPGPRPVASRRPRRRKPAAAAASAEVSQVGEGVDGADNADLAQTYDPAQAQE